MEKLIFIYIPSKYANDFQTKFHIKICVGMYHIVYKEFMDIENEEDIVNEMSNYKFMFYHINDKVLDTLIKYKNVESSSNKIDCLEVNIFNDLYNRNLGYPHYVVRFKNKELVEIVDECIININNDDIEIINKEVLERIEKETREIKE